MKRIFVILLSILIAFSCMSTAYAVKPDENDVSDYPVILVPGYSSSPLFLTKDDGTVEQVWGVDMDEIKNQVLTHIAELGLGLGALGAGEAKYIGETVGKAAVEMYGVLAYNPDGTSVNNISTRFQSAKECNWAALAEAYPDGEFRPEKEVMAEVANYVGEENIYVFYTDFRQFVSDCASDLDRLIQSVKEYTGKDKVNLISISHGGQVTGTYLSLYGHKNDVNNAVMIVPALGGAGFAYDAVSETAILDEVTLLKFIEHGMMSEEDYNWLVRANELGFLDDIIDYLIPYAKQIMGYWGSIWDFVPTDKLDGCFDLLDKNESEPLIEKTAAFHENVMAHYSQAFKKCRGLGMNVSVIAGTGTYIVTGLDENSDAIITTEASTGAKCAPMGKRFSDGYVSTGSVCTDRTHNHVSPSMEVDASYAYLPENTWFIDGLYHGMEIKDTYTTDLFLKLLIPNDVIDVHSDPAFPQFRASSNPAYAVFGTFSNSSDGYLSSKDTEYIVTNVSAKYPVRIVNISTDGIDLLFSAKTSTLLQPGESAVYKVKGEIPGVSLVRCAVTISYILEGSVTPVGERVLDYTIMNGENVEYDEDNPYCDVDYTQAIRDIIPSRTADILEKLGLLDFVNMFYNFVRQLATILKNLIMMFK